MEQEFVKEFVEGTYTEIYCRYADRLIMRSGYTADSRQNMNPKLSWIAFERNIGR